MNLKRRNGPRAIAALLLFFIAQIGLQVGLAGPTDTTTTPIPPQVAGRLTTSNNQPIQVNGLSASTGASILSGATLETGADQSATVNLGALGTVTLGPNTKLVLTFDSGNFKALVMVGCAKVSARANATGEIATDQGSAAKTNPASGGDIEVQYQPGTAPAVGQGVCPTGGGAAPPSDAGPSGGQGGLFGLGKAATIAIVGAGTAAALTPLWFQDNPSGPSN
jgi:hypothetical protein